MKEMGKEQDTTGNILILLCRISVREYFIFYIMFERHKRC